MFEIERPISIHSLRLSSLLEQTAMFNVQTTKRNVSDMIYRFYFRLRICTFDESIESKHDQCEARREEKENAKYYILCSRQLSVRRNAYKRTSVRYTVEESLVGMEKEQEKMQRKKKNKNVGKKEILERQQRRKETSRDEVRLMKEEKKIGPITTTPREFFFQITGPSEMYEQSIENAHNINGNHVDNIHLTKACHTHFDIICQ